MKERKVILAYMFYVGISKQPVMSPHRSSPRSVTENSLGIAHHSVDVYT